MSLPIDIELLYHGRVERGEDGNTKRFTDMCLRFRFKTVDSAVSGVPDVDGMWRVVYVSVNVTSDGRRTRR